MLLVNPQCIFAFCHQRKMCVLGSLGMTRGSNIHSRLKPSVSKELESKADDIKGEKLNENEAILIKHRMKKEQQKKKRCLLHCKKSVCR